MNIAALLPPAVCDLFSHAAAGIDVGPLATLAELSKGQEILLAAPGPTLGSETTQPVGWPFSLRWVHLLSSGLDGYPDWLFEGVTVTHSPGVSAIPLAEFALATMLSHARRLRELAVSAPEQWKPVQAGRLQGRTLGVVGMGAIGGALAKRALALGMNVIALRKSHRPMPQGVQRAVSLADLFAQSDHVVLAAPATGETRKMVDAAVLSCARYGMHLVNVARGSLIDQDALLEALDGERIALASLDVTDPEPLPAGHPFYSHPQVDLTPHSASLDDHVLPDLVAMFTENLGNFGAGRLMRWRVHGSAVDA